MPKFDNQTNWNLLIRCLLKLKNYHKNFKFLITGYFDLNNSFYLYFKKKIHLLGLKKNIFFAGYISDRNKLSNLLLKSKIGLTCYDQNFQTNYSKYADSLKIRDYAAHGLPILTEGLFYNSIETNIFRCSLSFKNCNDFLKSYKILSNKFIYDKYSFRSLQYSQKFNKTILLKNLLKNFQNIDNNAFQNLQ